MRSGGARAVEQGQGLTPGVLEQRLVGGGEGQDAQADMEAEQAASGQRRIKGLGNMAGVLAVNDQLGRKVRSTT